MSEKLTEEVSLLDKTLYLIRIDNVEKVIVEGKDEAKLVLDSLAQDECNKLQTDWVRVFRRDQTDGMKVSISTQSQGILINGFVKTTKRLDCIPVRCAFLVKGRHDTTKLPNVMFSNIKAELAEKLKVRRKYVSPEEEDCYIPPPPPLNSPVSKLNINKDTSKMIEAIYERKLVDFPPE